MTSTGSSQEQDYVKKRAVIKSKLTLFIKFIDKCEQANPLTTESLQTRISKIEEDFVLFEKIQEKLELLASDDTFETRLAERNDFTELYFESLERAQALVSEINTTRQVISRAGSSSQVTAFSADRTIIDVNETQVENTSPTVGEATTVVNNNPSTNFMPVQLPTMHLPTFSGSYEAWPGFCDAFRTAVHNNSQFRNTQKLMYLRSCLTGSAAEKLESLETTEANYSVAWNLLQKAYDDSSIVINNRIRAIFDLPLCTKSNPKTLGDLVDNATKHIRALQALRQPFLEAFPIYAITSKLDEATRRKWRERTQGNTFPSLDDLLEFLHGRFKLLEATNVDQTATKPQYKTQQSNSSTTPYQKKVNYPVRVLAATTNPTCNLCKGTHYTQYCRKILDVDVNQRFDIVKKAGLCTNCLRLNHTNKQCHAQTCKKCNTKHHTILHRETNELTPQKQPPSVALHANIPSQVLLSTALVNVFDSKGVPHMCRFLIDSGSQAHFLTQRVVRKLGLEETNINLPVSLLDRVVSNIKTTVKTNVQSRINNFSLNLNFLVIAEVSDPLPTRSISKGSINIPNNIVLADPKFYETAEIDGLLGAGIFGDLIRVGQQRLIKVAGMSVVLQGTNFGWIVLGRLGLPHVHDKIKCNIAVDKLQDQLSKFWEIEDCSSIKSLSSEEIACESHFQSNFSRNAEDGRYIVRIPFKEPISLGDSYKIALKRLYNLERSLNLKPDLKQQYIQFMREYIKLGHMYPVESPLVEEGYYIPHHAVVKKSSLTTKLRVVFDASAKSSNGNSLNNSVLIGPTIQEELFSLLLRFRTHIYVLTADIAKMYRQVYIHPDDRKYQRILWRESSSEPIQVFQLNTITYGTSCAPFLAIRSLHQLANDEKLNFPLASVILLEDFYVDDLLTGTRTFEEAVKVRDELFKLCNTGGFELRQWASNDPRLTEIFEDKSENSHMRLDLNETVNALGIHWDAKQDNIIYTIDEFDTRKRITKRIILSQIAQLFDPLGLLGPIIIRAKILMQDLWKLKLDWDDSLPSDIICTWTNYCHDLRFLREAIIPRKVLLPRYISLQLHGFSDASERAYGACIYLRSIDNNSVSDTHLLCSKSRVAPLKTLTLPRLELCAASLLVKLFNTVMKSLRRLIFDRIVFWCDSTIVLNWINTSPHLLKIFVAHRISEIQKVTSNYEWKYVPSKQNPADIISRGLSASEFLSSTLWHCGPSWLSDKESEWPNIQIPNTEIPETRTIKVLAIQTKNCELFLNFSSFTKLIRVIAYCLRFLNKTLRKEPSDKNLSVKELQNATNYILRIVQRDEFSREIDSIRNHTKLFGNLSSLSPFLDSDGILRVGGRLAHAKLRYESKHPILIPKNHHITKLIIREEHLRNFHSGIQATLHSVRRRFWIINGKSVIRNILHKCVNCQRVNPTTINYVMGNLPKDRINYVRPFLQTGVDFCGPIYIKEKIHRNRGKIKVYLAIFVCFVTKAVHIEIVSDLTTAAFLAALRRFFSRRGKSSDLYSDNATNFIGAKKELKELYAFINSTNNIDNLSKSLATEIINWHNIPPRSPHFGGLWEAAVKSVKYHLIRTVGDTLLAYEALLTYVNQIEAILNSRPLTPISCDPNDLSVLTPGHFLIGDALTSMPDYDLTGIPSGRLDAWQHIQQMRLHFWRRWSREYLQELTTRKKWHSGSAHDIKEGDIVILQDDNLPPLQWSLARVLRVHPGQDGTIRVVTVKSARGEFTRSVKKISPLLLDS